MADIRTLERDWKSGMGKVISDGILAVVDGDEAAKDAAMDRMLVMAKHANLVFEAETTLVGLSQKLQLALDVPALVAALTTNIGVKSADVDLSMDVDQHEEHNTNIDAKTQTEASAKFGFFGHGASVKTTASLGVGDERKRSTDYRSTVKVKVHMEQLPPAEGLSLIVDSITKALKRTIDINAQLVEKQATKLADEADKVDSLPIGDGNQPAQDNNPSQEQSPSDDD